MRIWMGKKCQNKNEVILIVYIVVLIAMLIITGCQEAQQTKVWGKGDLPSEWQGFFGDDNVARLDYVQTQTINNMGQAISVLAERLRKLDADPNDAYEAELKKRGLVK